MSEPAAFSCSVIVSGTLIDQPRSDLTKGGKECAKASFRVDGARVFVIAMGETAERLLELRAGDPVGLAGQITVSPREYQGAPALAINLFCTRVLDLKKRAKKAPGKASPDAEPFPAEAGDLEGMLL